MFRRLNQALPELMLGIFLYGLLIQLAGVWFVEDKVRYSSGLWIGIFTAMGMAYHIAKVIVEMVAYQDAEKVKMRVTAQSLLRYAAVVAIFAIMMYFDLGNLYTAFLGVMGLKISAYMQPLLHKAIAKVTGSRKKM